MTRLYEKKVVSILLFQEKGHHARGPNKNPDHVLPRDINDDKYSTMEP